MANDHIADDRKKVRLIDANEYPCNTCGISYCYKNCDKFNAWFEKTVDAVEVVHGRWISNGELDEDGNGQYHCSVCFAGEKHNPIVEVPYCWKCGAKMDGGKI